MTTILTVGNSEGSRSCTATCHDAKRPDCDCVCGGRYHGAGSDAVLDRVSADVEAGEFGDAARVETARQRKMLEQAEPDRVRFHVREVRRALAKRVERIARNRRIALGMWWDANQPTCPTCSARQGEPNLLARFDFVFEGYCSRCGATFDADFRDGAVTFEWREEA